MVTFHYDITALQTEVGRLRVRIGKASTNLTEQGTQERVILTAAGLVVAITKQTGTVERPTITTYSMVFPYLSVEERQSLGLFSLPLYQATIGANASRSTYLLNCTVSR